MRDNISNIRHLRAFLAVCRCQSISKATEMVFLSQPAITQAISKLEASLDSQLFDRTSTGMFPTEAGKVLAERIQRSLDILASGLKDAVKNRTDKKGSAISSLIGTVTTTQLKALIAVSGSSSFSNAGREMGVSQSSLHRSGRDLESALGVTLFEKTSFGISPTKAALTLTKAAKLAFAEIEQAREEVFALKNINIGQINIGSMPLVRTEILPGTIIEFSNQNREVRLSIYDGIYSDLLSHLRFADIDLIVGALRFPSPSDDIEQEVLFSSDVVVVGRPGHPFLTDSNLTAEKLASASWVVPKPGAPTRMIFDNYFVEQGLEPPKNIVESNSHILIRSLLSGSERLTMISEHQLQYEIDNQSLCVIPFSVPHAHRPIGIATRKGWKPTAQQQAFLDILRSKGRALAVEDM